MRIKFVSKTPVERMAPLWEPLLPASGIDGATFTFDLTDRDYDFLAVYEDFPPDAATRKVLHREALACPARHSLLITTEPASIRIEGPYYLSQYSFLATTQPAFQKNDDNGQVGRTMVLDETPPLRWFYGRDFAGTEHWTVDQIARSPEKSADLSTVTSNKAMDHTVHAARLAFVQEVKNRLGDRLALFGRGFSPVDNKAEAMAPYRYHLAIENHVQSGHHTEKLTDCFLAETLPFYFGDPYYDRVYPQDAVILIDIFDVDQAVAIIEEAIATDAFDRRRDALRSAKAIALEQSNPLRFAARVAKRSHAFVDQPSTQSAQPEFILGRHAFRRAHPVLAMRDAWHRLALKRSPYADPLQGLPALRARM